MYDVFIVMLVIMCSLAITDLVVGVSNDAVNFIGSAMGSKVTTFRNIMIIASIGVAIGAVFSNGMMEVARSGVFQPQMFEFQEVMVIFMAVMITDVILLDVFNTLGLPTSTTVSLVFELLGASVCVSLFKIYDSFGPDASVFKVFENFELLRHYINHSKALQMVAGILSVVFIAFAVGAVVQWFVRLLLSFKYEGRLKYFGGLLGGVAFTAIVFFMLLKGAKGTTLLSTENKAWIAANTNLLLVCLFVVFTIVSQALVSLFKINILKIIVLVGTFALAMAFAGNDLVNFIGVPLAAIDSYKIYIHSGAERSMLMGGLLAQAATPIFYLIGAGAVMVVTLWVSRKAKHVLKTSIDLSKTEQSDEKYEPSTFSKFIVRVSILVNKAVMAVVPQKTKNTIEHQFERPVIELPKNKQFEAPAFDLVRASVNVMVPAIIISIGTNSTLPLSTTYVTFMVAMGTSLSDRAWGRESAVYRVTGVVRVILGWFMTAVVAFSAAAVLAVLVKFFGMVAVIPLLILAVVLITSNKVLKKAKAKEEKRKKLLHGKHDVNIVQVIDESSQTIAEVFEHANEITSDVVEGLHTHKRAPLKKAKAMEQELKDTITELQNNVFYFIRSLNENSVETSRFYILMMDYLKDMNQSLSYIVNSSYEHVDNNHREMKDSRKEDLRIVNEELTQIFSDIQQAFLTKDFSGIIKVTDRKKKLKAKLNEIIEHQISKVRSEDMSPKNTNLFFGIILETKDLLSAASHLIEIAHEFYSTKKAKDKKV